jgi:hypothetical protein
MTDIIAVTPETIQSQIYTIRGKQVMMDRDLAILYGVETKRLNEQVRRNLERFPTDDFMFELTKDEFETLRSQIATSKNEGNLKSQFATSREKRGGLRYRPMVFGEPGIAMISAIIHSQTAIKISVQIMSAFVEMRKFLRDNSQIFVRLDYVERKLLKADENFGKLFDALESGDLKPKQGIFYDGQVFDAYVFVSDLIKSAKQSIVLIDNYVDETVLSLFTKRARGVSLTIYTQKISSQLALDLQKHNAQYEPIVIKEFKQAHDRFLILDGTVVYHIGASLKDLGKKWFAFSKMELSASDMLGKLI